MTCPSCSAPTVAEERFCTQCGQPLARTCTTCGDPLIEGARFCGSCGTRVDEPDSAEDSDEAIPERRLVTVLFADMVGYSTMSENRDPEEVRDFLSSYFVTAREIIQRYGGTVDKFIGDAVMGVWGTPVAQEDDAERAVRAALDLVGDVEALGARAGAPDIALRVGVATGEAAVFLGTPAGEGMAGDLVNTASRLEGAAQPGTVLVNDSTYRAATRAVAFEDAGEFALKGKSHPVHAWRPLQVTAKVGGGRGSGAMEGPFVGRRADLQTLRDMFRDTAGEGRAHLVSVIGVAGIGKSRLADELEKHLDGLVETTYWHRGRSPAYGDGVTFWALGEMVRTRARILDGDDEAEQRRKVHATVERFVHEEDRAWVEAGLELLLGLRPAGSIAAAEAESSWRRFFESIAEHDPTVLVFEDLHWADTGLIDFIESLLAWSRRYPLFILTLARPELLERRPTWGAGQPGFTGLVLEPLEDADVALLLDGLAPGLADEVKQAVIRRAEGVPLYVVETVRMLLDSNSGTVAGEQPELAIPETLHALVAARLDALGVDDRRLLQQAAVLGQTFDQASLSEVAGIPTDELGPRLDRLVLRQLLQIDDDPRSPERGFHQFVQGVVREVALGTIGRAERRRLHLQVADHFQSDGQDETLSVVVHHLTEAMRLGEPDEAEALAARAFDLLNRAADRAGGLGANDQALSFLDQAAALAPDDDARADLAVAAGRAAQMAGQAERAVEAWRDGYERLGRLGRAEDQAAAAASLANALLYQGRLDEAGALLEEVIARADSDDLSPSRRAGLFAQLGRVSGFRGDGGGTVESAERALALAGPAGAVAIVADALVTRGWGLYYLNRPDEALAAMEGGLWLAVRHQAPEPEYRARNNVASFLLWADPAHVLDLTKEGMDRARRRGDVENAVGLSSKAYEAAVSLGEWDWAEALLDDMTRVGVSRFAAHQLDLNEATLCALRGRFERADALVAAERKAADASESFQEQWYLHYRLATIQATKGDMAGSLRHALAAEVLRKGFEYPRVGLAAVRAGDQAALGTVIENLEAMPRLDFRTAAWLDAMRGCRALAQGDDEGAVVREACSALRKAGLIVDVADWSGELAMLLPDGLNRQTAAADARAIWSQLGAPSQIELLDRRLAG